MNQQLEKALLNLEDFCSYLGIGKTKARELLKDHQEHFPSKSVTAITPTRRNWINGLIGTVGTSL